MKKKLSLICLSLFSLGAFAQWTPTGDNSATGNLSIGSYNSGANRLWVKSKESSQIIFNPEHSSAQAIIAGNIQPGGGTTLNFLTRESYIGGKNMVLTHMTLDQYGKVGIGTQTPTAKLEVVGALKATDITATNNLVVSKELKTPKLTASSEITAPNIVVGDINREDASRIWIKSKNASEIILNTSHSAVQAIIRGTSPDGGGSNLKFMTRESHIGGKNQVLTRMTIDNTGKVGIGTETPTETLDVVGNIKATNIIADAKIGIGTKNPTATLDVAGSIKAHDITVEIPAGADFVFAEDYNLRPLSEVETFVKENKHLPEVQSEKKMQEEGVNINEFQIKLLQKIEELTLYIIAQEKRIAEQDKRIAGLENQEK